MNRTVEPSTTIAVKVVPRASSNEIVGWREGVLRLRVTAPPEHGRANEAVAGLLASALRLRKSAVSIVAGHGSPQKRVAVTGLRLDEIERRLAVS
jgi:uncharacterized protein (TIGR00251 family)